MKYSKGKITLAKRVISNKIVQKIELDPTPEKARPPIGNKCKRKV